MIGEINTGSNGNHGVYLQAKILSGNDKEMNMNLLLDSGASVSLMSKTMLERIKKEFPVRVSQTEVTVKFADGSLQPGIGTVKTPVIIGKQVENIEFLVGNFSDEMIIGMKDLKTFGLTIDFSTGVVKQGKLWLPTLDQNRKPLVNKVIVSRVCVLAPRTQSIIQACVQTRKCGTTKEEKSNPVMLNPVQSVINELGVLPARSLHDEHKKIIPVLMYNPREEPVVIEPNTILGLLTPVETVPEEEQLAYMREHMNKPTDCRRTGDSKDTNSTLPEHVQDLYKRSIELLGESEREMIKRFLIKNADVYSKHEFDLGKTNVLEHKLPTGDAIPIRCPPNRLSKDKKEASKEIVDKLFG